MKNLAGPYGRGVASPRHEEVSLDWLEREKPWIPWREPIAISSRSLERLGHKSRLGCRICIAQKGIAAPYIIELPQTMQEHEDHLAGCHGIKREDEHGTAVS